MATVPFVQQNIVIGRKLHFSFSISRFRAFAPTLYFHCKHFTPLLFVDTFIRLVLKIQFLQKFQKVFLNCTCDQNISYQWQQTNTERENFSPGLKCYICCLQCVCDQTQNLNVIDSRTFLRTNPIPQKVSTVLKPKCHTMPEDKKG